MKISEKLGSLFTKSGWKSSASRKAFRFSIIAPIFVGLGWGCAKIAESLFGIGKSLRGRAKVVPSSYEQKLEKINSSYQGDYPAVLENNVLKIRVPSDAKIIETPADPFEGCKLNKDDNYLEIPLDKYHVEYTSKPAYRTADASRTIVITNSEGISQIYTYSNPQKD